ncbi:MAG TPA: hypothetical protein VHK47_00005, partial [Polyangia bacterium]|nr:hypothetical protein [Polyangia bacterium]
TGGPGTACTSGDAGTGGPGTAGTTGAAGSAAGSVGSTGAAGTGTAGTSGTAGTTGAAGSGGSTGAAGSGGTTGAAGTTGTAGTSGIGEDIPPWRELMITVTPGLHMHTTPGTNQSSGMDNRAAKMAGKLVVDMGVNGGGYQSYLGKRGFHVIGITSVNSCDGIDDWSLGRDFDGDCRLNTLDGMPHGNQNKVTPDKSIMTQVFNALTTFEKSYPGEGWGYFLTKDLKGVRWSDVAFTGFSHGAQSAVCFATELRLYRAVPQSGPRDNTCGLGPAKGPFDPAHLPYDPNCPVAHIASWLDKPFVTPIDRIYGFTGGNDGQFGDIMFTMQYMHFVGDFVNLDTATAPYGGSHRFYSLKAGHSGFPNGFPIDAINIAFGVLPENANPNF